MSQQISLDIGFDRLALAKPGDAENALLAHGFTVISEEANPIVTGRTLKIGDDVKLTLYDLSEKPGCEETATIDHLSLSIEIAPAREQGAIQPFQLVTGAAAVPTTTFASYRIFRAVAPTGWSSVFGGNFPSWNVYPPDSSAATFPASQLGSGRQPPRPTFRVVAGGHFYFTLRLDVRWTDSRGAHEKCYRDDPEMIIDTTNGVVPTTAETA